MMEIAPASAEPKQPQHRTTSSRRSSRSRSGGHALDEQDMVVLAHLRGMGPRVPESPHDLLVAADAAVKVAHGPGARLMIHDEVCVGPGGRPVRASDLASQSPVPRVCPRCGRVLCSRPCLEGHNCPADSTVMGLVVEEEQQQPPAQKKPKKKSSAPASAASGAPLAAPPAVARQQQDDVLLAGDVEAARVTAARSESSVASTMLVSIRAVALTPVEARSPESSSTEASATEQDRVEVLEAVVALKKVVGEVERMARSGRCDEERLLRIAEWVSNCSSSAMQVLQQTAD